MKRVIVSSHARKRLKEDRQKGIRLTDMIRAATIIPGTISSATRFRGYVSVSGRAFDIVVKDINEGRLVITVIGK